MNDKKNRYSTKLKADYKAQYPYFKLDVGNKAWTDETDSYSYFGWTDRYNIGHISSKTVTGLGVLSEYFREESPYQISYITFSSMEKTPKTITVHAEYDGKDQVCVYENFGGFRYSSESYADQNWFILAKSFEFYIDWDD